MHNRWTIVTLLAGASCAPTDAPPAVATTPPTVESAPAPASPYSPEQPMEIGEAPASATPAQRQALYWVNTYRTLAGVAPVAQQAALNDSATNHARFVTLNRALYDQGLGAHDQSPSGAGFTGEHFWERISASGYAGDPFGEVIAYQARPASAVAHWMETPYHRLPLLHAAATDVGYAEYGSGLDYVNVLDVGHDAAVSGALPRGVVWPPNDAEEVPIAWDGAENPKPPAPKGGFPSGPVLSVQFDRGATLASVETELLDEDGAPVAHVRTSSDTDPNLEHEAAVIVYAERPLKGDSRYTVRISGTVDGSPFERQWSFHTRAGDRCDLVSQDCGVGQGCFVTKTATVCAWDGALTEGEACAFQNDCRGGLTCAGGVCRPFCRLGATGSEACTTRCPAGASPLAVTGFGVCKSPK